MNYQANDKSCLWAHADSYGLNGLIPDPYGLIWGHLGSYGLIWAHRAHGPKWAHTGPYSHGLTRAHAGSDGNIWGHMGSYGHLQAHMDSYGQTPSKCKQYTNYKQLQHTTNITKTTQAIKTTTQTKFKKHQTTQLTTNIKT